METNELVKVYPNGKDSPISVTKTEALGLDALGKLDRKKSSSALQKAHEDKKAVEELAKAEAAKSLKKAKEEKMKAAEVLKDTDLVDVEIGGKIKRIQKREVRMLEKLGKLKERKEKIQTKEEKAEPETKEEKAVEEAQAETENKVVEKNPNPFKKEPVSSARNLKNGS